MIHMARSTDLEVSTVWHIMVHFGDVPSQAVG